MCNDAMNQSGKGLFVTLAWTLGQGHVVQGSLTLLEVGGLLLPDVEQPG